MSNPSSTPLDGHNPGSDPSQTVGLNAGSTLIEDRAEAEHLLPGNTDDGSRPADEPAERGLISRLLPPAIRLWLHSQLDQLEGLGFQLEGKDRQILSGHIPQVRLSAQQAVYRGLHVSQVAVLKMSRTKMPSKA